MPWDSGAGSIDQLVQGFSFSQPACPEHMLLNSQLLGTPGSSQVRGCTWHPVGHWGCSLAVFGMGPGEVFPSWDFSSPCSGHRGCCQGAPCTAWGLLWGVWGAALPGGQCQGAARQSWRWNFLLFCHLGCEFAGFGAQLFSVFSARVNLCRGLGVFGGGTFTSDLQPWDPTLHCMNWGAALHHGHDHQEQLCHI